MPNLSTPIGELRSRYGVVVVGSGYGGAIAAYRLATAANDLRAAGRPSFSVCLLERGLEIRPGDYPSTFANGVRGTQVDTRLGRVGKPTSLFDFHINREVSVLVGCGLGGTSLINANVMLQPAALGAEWPEDLRRTGLAREFAMAADALGAAPMPPDVTLNKVTKLFDAARDAGFSEHN